MGNIKALLKEMNVPLCVKPLHYQRPLTILLPKVQMFACHDSCCSAADLFML